MTAQIARTGTIDNEDGAFSMDAVAELVRQAGVACYVEHTGGGCATIFAGQPVENEAEVWTNRYPVCAGPGVIGRPATGWLSDFYVGADDDDETDACGLADSGVTTVEQVAALIVATAVTNQRRPLTRWAGLDADALDAIGLDGTGRGLLNPNGPAVAAAYLTAGAALTALAAL